MQLPLYQDEHEGEGEDEDEEITGKSADHCIVR